MRRVVIVGPGGAGKSTLADELGRNTGLPVVHLDHHYWLPGRVERSRDEWRAVQRRLLSGDDWIADGNFSGTLDERLPRADTVVFFDFPAWRTLARVARRRLTRARVAGAAPTDTAPAVGARRRSSRLRFLSGLARYRARTRPVVLDAIRRFAPAADVHVLRSTRAVRAFADSTRATDTGGPGGKPGS